MDQVAAIVLAAGFSSRLPAFKPLVELDGCTFLERAVRAFSDVDITSVLVVTGHRGAEVALASEALAARPVHNERYAQGMYASVQAGVAALPSEVSRFFVLPVDCALVLPETIGRLTRAAWETDADVVYPEAGGTRGHPPLVDAKLRAEILGQEPPGGLRALLQTHAERSLCVRVTDPGVLFDADTAADLSQALPLARAADLPGESLCSAILKERGVPARVVAHSRAVRAVAGGLAKALNERGWHLCLPLVAAAALLHDVARGEPSHAEAGAALLTSLGYPRVAAVVRSHMDLGQSGGDVGEAEVVYLADKLVLDDRVVSLEERFSRRAHELAGDAQALTAAHARRTAAFAVRRRVEQVLGRGLDQDALSGMLASGRANAGWSTRGGPRLLSPGGPDCLVADLDGTLLEPAGRALLPGVAAALCDIVDAGSTFCVCTGRPSAAAIAAAEAMGIPGGFAVVYGGAETRELGRGEPLVRVAMPDAVTGETMKIAGNLGLAVAVHDSPAGPLRLVLTGTERDVEGAAVALLEALGETVVLLRPAAGVLAVQDALATKERALAALMERLGISAAAVAYFGDAADDAPALAWAGLGVAVGAGSPEAAAAADVVIASTSVVEMIGRLAGSRRLRALG